MLITPHTYISFSFFIRNTHKKNGHPNEQWKLSTNFVINFTLAGWTKWSKQLIFMIESSLLLWLPPYGRIHMYKECRWQQKKSFVQFDFWAIVTVCRLLSMQNRLIDNFASQRNAQRKMNKKLQFMHIWRKKKEHRPKQFCTRHLKKR